MTAFTFTKAVKQQEKLRLALDGPSGAGKTWTSLLIGTYLAGEAGGRIAVIDSERGSAKKYASDFDFDHLSLPDSNPHTYTGAIGAAADAGYAVLIVDSLSHAWEGTLELKDEVAKRSRNDSFGAWREVTPVHNDLVDALLRFPGHLIVTMRTKTHYAIDEVEEDGRKRTKITKLGLKPIQRDGVEYEFDVVGDLDQENTLVISKTRCPALAGAVIRRPDEQLAKTLAAWLDDGVPVIDPVTTGELKDALNARTGPVRAAWMEQFGVKPDALPAERLDEARKFLADHPVDGDEPPPAGGGQDPAGGSPPGQPDGGAATDVSGDASDAAPPTPSEPAPPAAEPTPDERGAAVSVSDVGRYSTTVFKRDYDAAAHGSKTKVVERLRHALTYVATGGKRSLNECTGPELVTVMQWLRHIHDGAVHYGVDDTGVTFVLVATGEEHAVPWSTVDLQAVA